MADRDWRPFVYGGLASCAAEFGTFPIDTTKTRLQIQGQKHDAKHKNLKYHGMIDAFLKITKQEGFQALYAGSQSVREFNGSCCCQSSGNMSLRGKEGFLEFKKFPKNSLPPNAYKYLFETFRYSLVSNYIIICIHPAVLRQATYGTIKFGTYYSLKKLFGERKDEDIFINVGCAVAAGIVSSSIANPTDVLKVRMQVLGVQTNSIVGCFQEVYRLEGIGGLWRGVGPTAQRAAVIAAVELPVYDMCKHHLMSTFGDKIFNHFISSFIASLGSAVASTPIDVIRTRLMNQKKLKNVSDAKIYKGTIDCLLQTVKAEGLLALYKGFIPTWVRMGPWNIIFFIIYEQLKTFY